MKRINSAGVSYTELKDLILKDRAVEVKFSDKPTYYAERVPKRLNEIYGKRQPTLSRVKGIVVENEYVRFVLQDFEHNQDALSLLEQKIPWDEVK